MVKYTPYRLKHFVKTDLFTTAVSKNDTFFLTHYKKIKKKKLYKSLFKINTYNQKNSYKELHEKRKQETKFSNKMSHSLFYKAEKQKNNVFL